MAAEPRITVIVCVPVGSPLTWTNSLSPEPVSTSWRTSWFIRNEASPSVRPVVVVDESATPSVVDRERYGWVYIKKSVRSTGTYGSRVTNGLRLAYQLLDGHGDVVAGFNTRLVGSKEPLEVIAHRSKLMQRSRFSPRCLGGRLSLEGGKK